MKNEGEYVGKMPIREDVPVREQTSLNATIQDLIYYNWMIADKLIPEVHEKHQCEIAEWEKGYEEGEKAHHEWCKKEWAAGRSTLLIEYMHPVPYPVPRKSGPLQWEIGEIKFVNALTEKKDA